MFRMLVICSVASTTLISCALDDSGESAEHDDSPGNVSRWLPLVDATLWRETPAAADPLAAHHDASMLCPRGAWYVEPAGVEVDTSVCAYVSLGQPLGEDIAAGDTLRLVAWWQTLVSFEPARAHLAVLIDDVLLWDEYVDVPGPASARSIELASPDSFPAGSMVTFHLHNHGFNAWTFSELARRVSP